MRFLYPLTTPSLKSWARGGSRRQPANKNCEGRPVTLCQISVVLQLHADIGGDYYVKRRTECSSLRVQITPHLPTCSQ